MYQDRRSMGMQNSYRERYPRQEEDMAKETVEQKREVNLEEEASIEARECDANCDCGCDCEKTTECSCGSGNNGILLLVLLLLFWN